MRFSKLFRRILGSYDSITSADSGCDVRRGLKEFIDSGTASIIEAPFIGVCLEDTLVTLKHDSDNTDNANRESSSSSSNNAEDVTDGKKIPGMKHRAVKVNQVNLGSFAHGFGLRENDIILTVNNNHVESADMASYMIQRTIGCDKNSKLVLEIQRQERGYIRLDNLGDEIEVEEVFDGDLICVSCPNQLKVYRFKHLKYQNYLTVRSDGTISLSKFKTPKYKTEFVTHHYQGYSMDSGSLKYVMIQHVKSKKCIWAENGAIFLKDPPSGTKLPQNSNYLFDLNTISEPQGAVFFNAINSPDEAVGFKRKRDKAELLGWKDEKDRNDHVVFTPHCQGPCIRCL